VTGEPYRKLYWDGAALALEAGSGRRRLALDARCLDGPVVRGCFAHVCALPDDAARLPFDQPEVQQARRDALAWWIPLLGAGLVCLSTFSTDSVHCGGAVTVARSAELFRDDLFACVPPPCGPLVERTAGAPWPGGSF
jgi:hypothetical protein